jgi:hypothetical protein
MQAQHPRLAHLVPLVLRKLLALLAPRKPLVPLALLAPRKPLVLLAPPERQSLQAWCKTVVHKYLGVKVMSKSPLKATDERRKRWRNI